MLEVLIGLGRTYKNLGNKEQSINGLRSIKIFNYILWSISFLELNPNGNFELKKDMEVDKRYRDIFFNKELVKIIYLLDELNKDKYTKFIFKTSC